MLTKARNTPERGTKEMGYPVAAGAVIQQGGLVVLDAGYATRGATDTGLVAVGRAEAKADNSAGQAGDVTVLVRRGCFQFNNSSSTDEITQADVGATAYVVDDETVAKTNGGSPATRSAAGVIEAVDAGGVWVSVGQ